MDYISLKSHIASKQLMPAYYLTGDDEYLKTHSISMLGAIIDNPAFNIQRLSSVTDEVIVEALQSYPVMSDYKLVVVDELPSKASKLIEYLNKPNDFSILIIRTGIERKAGKRGSDSEEIKKLAEEINCLHLDKPMLLRWIGMRQGQLGVAVDAAAANLLIDYLKNDLSAIDSELTKFADYVDDKQITADIIEKYAYRIDDYKIWEITDALAKGDGAKAMIIVDAYEREKMEFYSLLSIVYKHFHNLFYVLCSDEEDALSILGLKQSNYYRLITSAKKFGVKKLKKTLSILSDYDYASKSGKLDMSVATRSMVVSLVGGN